MNAGREYPPDAAPLRPSARHRSAAAPAALRGRVPGRDAGAMALFSSPRPLPPGEGMRPPCMRGCSRLPLPRPAQRPCAPRSAPAPSPAALLRPPPQRSCALKDNWRRRGCRRQYTWLWGAATVGCGSVGRRSERYGKRGSPPTAFARPDRSIVKQYNALRKEIFTFRAGDNAPRNETFTGSCQTMPAP
jgi:hypothetical protein